MENIFFNKNGEDKLKEEENKNNKDNENNIDITNNNKYFYLKDEQKCQNKQMMIY